MRFSGGGGGWNLPHIGITYSYS